MVVCCSLDAWSLDVHGDVKQDLQTRGVGCHQIVACGQHHFVKYCIGIFKYAYIYYVILDLYFILCMPIIVLL